MNRLPDHPLDLTGQFLNKPLIPSRVIHHVSVYLFKSIDLVTHTGISHFNQGPALIPSDLARLLYRSHSAIPLASYKPSPSPKQSKH